MIIPLMNTSAPANPAASRKRHGFSLVEMMASVAIIGIIAFLAIPSISRMREDSEKNLAIARAEALNVAQATLVQVKGRTQAQIDWSNQASNDAKYQLLVPYLSYAEATRTLFMPDGWQVTFNASIVDMRKARLFDPSNVEVKY